MGCMLSNSGHDENGNYTGGRAGDQTGTEWQIIPWYNRPWNCVLRPKRKDVAEMIAADAVDAANNDHIGYNQGDRNSFGYANANVGYKPAKITVNCNSDCSKGVIDITKGVGNKLNISSLKNLPATYTGNMRSAFFATGEFEVLTASKYLTSGNYCLLGDICLNDNHHTATVVASGGSSSEKNQGSSGSGSGNRQFAGKGIGTATALVDMNIRSQASTGGSILGAIDPGEEVEVLEVLSSGWYKIVWTGSSAGYAYTSNQTGTYYSYKAKAGTKTLKIDPALCKDKNLAGSYKVNVPLNLRTGAGTNKDVILEIPAGSYVNNYQYYNKDKNGCIWLYVAYKDKTGYVCTEENGREYLTHTKNL